MEPVSQWYYYADLIENMDVDVHLAHPMRVKAIAAARVKTDKIDAGVLCDLLRGDLLPEAYFSSVDVRSWKEQCRFRASLLTLRTQVKNKIHAILFKHALKHNFSNLFGKGGRAWLESLKLNEPFKTNLDKYLFLADQFTELISQSEQTIQSTVTNNPQANLLISIPGISYCSALTIMGEIGDINRFNSAKKLQGYAGLVPSTYSSGDKQIHGRITKQGSKWLRWIMIEAAYHQERCKRIPGFGSYYVSMKKRRGTKTAAVATARKLLAVVWRLLKDNRPYEVNAPHSWKSGTLA
jgi:transposase